MAKPPKPCIERLPDGRGCPEYAVPGKSRCAQHQAEAVRSGRFAQQSGGTSAAWRKARKEALERDGWACTNCGKTQEQAKAESPLGRGLEVHHLPGTSDGIRAAAHNVDDLRTLCRPCHQDLRRRGTRPTFREWAEQQRRERSTGLERSNRSR